MTKIVINNCYGGFGVSTEGMKFINDLKEKRGKPKLKVDEYEEPMRDDVELIEAIEILGSDKVSGQFGSLKIVEIPDGLEWEIDEYDGMESVDEAHRSWS